MNEVTLLGRAGKDPEINNLPDGQKVCKLSIATTEVWKDKEGEKKEHSEWHNVECWGKTAEVFQKYVFKGDMVFIKGKLRTDKYEDKQGVTKYTTKVIVNTLELLPKGGSGKKQGISDKDLTDYINQLPESTKSSFKEGLKEFIAKRKVEAASKEAEAAVDDLPF